MMNCEGCKYNVDGDDGHQCTNPVISSLPGKAVMAGCVHGVKRSQSGYYTQVSLEQIVLLEQSGYFDSTGPSELQQEEELQPYAETARSLAIRRRFSEHDFDVVRRVMNGPEQVCSCCGHRLVRYENDSPTVVGCDLKPTIHDKGPCPLDPKPPKQKIKRRIDWK